MKTKTFVSVVVCTYNGSEKIDPCLKSLLKQNYEDFEIIVVDDGSTDNVASIIKKYPVKLYRYTQNKGLSAARNVGIKHAKGEIIAFTDDDCIADIYWLSALVKGYTNEEIAGVGGIVQVNNKENSIFAQFVRERNPLGPMTDELLVSNNIFYRFHLYIKNMYNNILISKPTRAYSLIGANMSFRKDILAENNGFDELFTFGADEEDLCKRIHKNNKAVLLYVPDAIISHHFDVSMKGILKKNYAYGIGSARMFCKYSDRRPTIFPFPFLMLFLMLLGYFFRPFVILGIIVPIFVYGKWMLQSIKTRKVYYLIFAYIQMLCEMFNNIGFIAGYRMFRNQFAQI